MLRSIVLVLASVLVALSAAADKGVSHKGIKLGIPAAGGGTGGPFTFVASASGGADGSGTTVDTSSTLNVVAGDVLLTMVSFEDGHGNETVSVKDTSNTNVHTFTTGDDVHEASNLTSVYPLFVTNAEANSTATFRATLSDAHTFKRIIVMQYRPATGASVSKDITGTRENSGNGSAITTGTFSTTGTYTVVCAMEAIYTSGSHSNSTIGGVAAEQSKIQNGAFQWCRTAGALTNQTASTTYSAIRQWSATVLALKSEGGTYVDLIPPVDPAGISGTAGNAQVALTWSHSNPSDVAHYDVQYDCGGGYIQWSPNPTSASVTITGLTNDVACNFKVAASDSSNNMSAFNGPISRTPTAAPVRSNGAPTGTLISGTTSTSISLTTSVNATCKYSTTPNTAYTSMTETLSGSGTTSHSGTVSGLSDGNYYHYYVRCTDGVNANGTDYEITFYVMTEQVSNCTDGVDCFCDTAPTNVFCEDFESAKYYENTATGDWVDHVGQEYTCYRGGSSEWITNYPGQNAGLFDNGEPANPRVGCSCSAGGSKCAAKEYCSAAQGAIVDGGGADCWQGNNSASIDIQRSGDFNYEIGSLTLTGGKGTTADVGAGNQHHASRVVAGNVAGIQGRAYFGAQYTELGLTKAHAYSSNMGSISLCDDPWKHDEWESNNSDPGGYIENFGVGNTGIRGYDGSSCGDGFPYAPIMFHNGNQSACSTAANNATVTVGSIGCNGAALTIGASASVYTQSTHFPFGTWHCMRAHIKGMGTSNMEYRIWHDNTLVFEMTGFDGTVLKNPGYRAFHWNNYANANQGQGEDASTATGYRYVDNIIVVPNGPPVSCATIGY